MSIKATHIFWFLIVISFASCSTEKDKRLNRFYHNTTAYYNGYFNAREIIKLIKKEFNKNTVEDFSNIIPVNRYPDEEQSKAFFPEMNRVIDKTSKVINKHAMPNIKKGRDAKKEYGKWIDENWLTMGVGYFYKREYPAAIEKFEYIIKMYPKDPSVYYAKLWLMKTYIEMGDYPMALKYYKEIEVMKEAFELNETREKKKKARGKKYQKKTKKKKRKKRSKVKVTKKREELKEEKSFLVQFPEEMNADYYATIADFYLRKEEYAKVVDNLDSAINFEKTKQLRVRYSFIQAQLSQELGDNAKASELYSYVTKKSADYKMAFYSRINRALIANSKDRENLKQELLSLAKDEKYIEFRDQIYFAVANIELQAGNKESGVMYLERAASYPPSNTTQKGKTFLRLADVYFEDKEYISAQKYYDSTLSELNSENPNYPIIEEKNQSLTRLVGYINTIALQDSLMKIASLPEKQRRDMAEDILYKEKQRKQDLLREKENEVGGAKESTNDIFSGPATTGRVGKFWMYNESAKEKGKKKFAATWGDIKVEDNWRRSNKGTSSVDEIESLDGAPIVSDEEIDDFLKKLPVGEEKMKESQQSIINANFLAGLIYANILDNNKEAVKSFTDNKKRFHPEAKITPSLYQLYTTYQDLGQREDEVATKNFILSNYPESKEAKILLDPNYANKLKKGEEKFETAYLEVFNLVNEGKNQIAITKIGTILSSPEPNPYECNLMFLKAKAYADMGNLDSLEVSLAKVVETCPNTRIGDIAEKNLGKLRNKQFNAEENEDVKYKTSPNGVHYFAIVLPLNADVNTLKIALSNFNSTSFDEKGLKTTSIGLNKTTQTVLIKQFDNKADAQSYYVAFKVNPMMQAFTAKYQYFTITPENYSLLFQSKEIEEYFKFYQANYL